MGEFVEYKRVSDSIGGCIAKVAAYVPIFSVKLLNSAEEINVKYFRILSLCGKRQAPNKWQFFVVEGLMNPAKQSITLTKEFALKDLKRVAFSNTKENYVQFGFGSKNVDYAFEKIKPRDAMLWCLLTLFFKTNGKYPELVRVNLVELDKLAECNKFSAFHGVFKMKLEIESINKSTMTPLKGDQASDEERMEVEEELTEVEAASERLGVLKTLSNSKNLKEDYKQIQRKLYSERQQIVQGIINCMRDKEKDKKKLLDYTDKIDNQFSKMQAIFRIFNS
jgi:hypothetical protein